MASPLKVKEPRRKYKYTALRSLLPCVQEVVTPIYIVTHYINYGNYFLNTQ